MSEDAEDDLMPPGTLPGDPAEPKAARELMETAKQLYYCLCERYRAHRGLVLHGGNSVAFMSLQPTEDEACRLAADLDAAVAPIRRRRAADLVERVASLAKQVNDEIS